MHISNQKNPHPALSRGTGRGGEHERRIRDLLWTQLPGTHRHDAMENKSIKTERDYRRALKLIDKLMDADRNTSEGKRLHLLAMLVEAWEAKRYPIDDPSSQLSRTRKPTR